MICEEKNNPKFDNLKNNHFNKIVSGDIPCYIDKLNHIPFEDRFDKLW